MYAGQHQDRAVRFGLTFDYRCPFARNLHEHVVKGLESGALWSVAFLPFSLNQVHVGPGAPDVWDDPARAGDLLALQVGVAVRDGWSDRFLSTHTALFAARHDRGLDLRDENVVRAVLRERSLDPEAVLEEVASGRSRETVRREHEEAVAKHLVFGVPTVIVDDHAAFVRIMDRPGDDASKALGTVERILDLISGWPELNELKFTTIPN